LGKVYIGIDPGKSGALAYIEVNDAQITGKVMPFSEAGYRFIIRYLAEEYAGNIVCAVEQVSAMPGQGVTSMFNFGKGFGWILGTLEAYSVPYELIRPQKWKKEFSVTSDKNTSIEVCKRLFPHVSLLPTERCKKDNDGMAEALLLAEYATRKM
jgi:crossover junction endodeoxyribonuclease RuvC